MPDTVLFRVGEVALAHSSPLGNEGRKKRILHVFDTSMIEGNQSITESTSAITRRRSIRH